jgi:hypothetical protein
MVVWQTHAEYFVGWDGLLRVGIGLALPLTVAGPCGFFGSVGERIGCHTWNVLEHYPAKVASAPLVGVNVREGMTDGS